MTSASFSQGKDKIGTVLLLTSLASQTRYKCRIWKANYLSFIISITYVYHLAIAFALSPLEVNPCENIAFRIVRIICHMLQQCACNAVSTFLLKYRSETSNDIDITVIKQQMDSQNNS